MLLQIISIRVSPYLMSIRYRSLIFGPGRANGGSSPSAVSSPGCSGSLHLGTATTLPPQRKVSEIQQILLEVHCIRFVIMETFNGTENPLLASLVFHQCSLMFNSSEYSAPRHPYRPPSVPPRLHLGLPIGLPWPCPRAPYRLLSASPSAPLSAPLGPSMGPSAH